MKIPLYGFFWHSMYMYVPPQLSRMKLFHENHVRIGKCLQTRGRNCKVWTLEQTLDTKHPLYTPEGGGYLGEKRYWTPSQTLILVNRWVVFFFQKPIFAKCSKKISKIFENLGSSDSKAWYITFGRIYQLISINQEVWSIPIIVRSYLWHQSQTMKYNGNIKSLKLILSDPSVILRNTSYR